MPVGEKWLATVRRITDRLGMRNHHGVLFVDQKSKAPLRKDDNLQLQPALYDGISLLVVPDVFVHRYRGVAMLLQGQDLSTLDDQRLDDVIWNKIAAFVSPTSLVHDEDLQLELIHDVDRRHKSLSCAAWRNMAELRLKTHAISEGRGAHEYFHMLGMKTKGSTAMFERCMLPWLCKEITGLPFEAVRMYNTLNRVSQVGQDLYAMHHYKHKRGGVFVDIGASDGVTWSNSYLLERCLGWRGIYRLLSSVG